MFRLLERRARFVEEALADMRERHAAGLAHEQLGAEQRLQSLDLRAQRRRGDIQPRRRPGEMQLFGHGHEVSEMSKLHGPIMRLRLTKWKTSLNDKRPLPTTFSGCARRMYLRLRPVCDSRVTICLASAEET